MCSVEKAADRSFDFTPVRRLESELVLLVVLVLSLRLFLVLCVVLVILILAVLIVLAVLVVLVILVLHKAHLTFAEGRMCRLWQLYAVKIWKSVFLSQCPRRRMSSRPR